MIPKKIHYCWFGKGKKSRLALKCIESWHQYCPDYEMIEWNEENFDIDMNGYTRMCYAEKKYAPKVNMHSSSTESRAALTRL